MPRNVNTKLYALLALSETITAQLQNEDIEAAIAALKQREGMLEEFGTDQFKDALQSCLKPDGRISEQTRNLVKRILQLDNQNMEVIKQKIEETSDMISELAREQDAVKKLRVSSHARPKQIVDFLY